VAEFLESLDGFIARVIVGDHLREEQAQGDPGTRDPVSPLMTAETAGRFDGGAREEVEKREAVSSAEPVSHGMDLVASRVSDRLCHGDVLAAKRGGACVYHQVTNQGRRRPLFKQGNLKSNPREG
jgi:hypothetical protein